VGMPNYFGMDPFAPMYLPGTTGTTRQRIGEPGALTAGPSARDPFVVGSAGWTRSIPVDFIEREKEYIVRADIPGTCQALGDGHSPATAAAEALSLTPCSCLSAAWPTPDPFVPLSALQASTRRSCTWRSRTVRIFPVLGASRHYMHCPLHAALDVPAEINWHACLFFAGNVLRFGHNPHAEREKVGSCLSPLNLPPLVWVSFFPTPHPWKTPALMAAGGRGGGGYLPPR